MCITNNISKNTQPAAGAEILVGFPTRKALSRKRKCIWNSKNFLGPAGPKIFPGNFSLFQIRAPPSRNVVRMTFLQYFVFCLHLKLRNTPKLRKFSISNVMIFCSFLTKICPTDSYRSSSRRWYLFFEVNFPLTSVQWHNFAACFNTIHNSSENILHHSREMFL